MSLLLAIDTSGDQVGLALIDDEMVAELSWPARQRQTTTILQGLDQLLRLSGRTVQEVEVVAVATGPGSFSGLRVGLSVAKGLVLAREVALVGVPTLLATALPHLSPWTRTVAVAAAGRERLVWAIVEDGVPEAAVIGRPTNGSGAELLAFVADMDGPVVTCGEVPADVVLAWADDPLVAYPSAAGRRPLSVGRIGWARWRRGEVDDPAALQPAYLHLGVPG